MINDKAAVVTIVYFLTAAGWLKSSCRHSACIRTKKPRNVNEDLQDEQT